MSIAPDDPRLTAYVLDELPAAERSAFERDLADDRHAQAEVAALRALLPTVAAALDRDPVVTAQPAAVTPEPVRAPARARWARLAAALVVGLGLTLGVLAVVQEPTVVQRRASRLEVSEIQAPETQTPETQTPETHAPRPIVPAVDARRPVIRGEMLLEEVQTDNDLPFESSFGESGEALRDGSFEGPANNRTIGIGGGAGGAFAGRGGPARVLVPASQPAPDPGVLRSELERSRRLLVLEGSIGNDRGYHDPQPPQGGDDHGHLVDEGWKQAERDHTSTFSLDVDTASLAIVRRSVREGRLPPPDAVRIEELINAFDHGYAPPEAGSEHALRVHADVVGCPWAPTHRLVRLGLKAREVDAATRPPLHLVFLVDVSGSMARADRLPLAQHALGLLLARLEPRDRLALVTYAGTSSVALPSTPCTERETIQAAIDALTSGGSTNGADGLRLAYEQARAAPAVEGAIRRVLLLTDGDFNVGVSDTATLEARIAEEAATGVWLSVFGFGMGNLKDDRLERLSNRGNGTYAYVDGIAEAQRVLVDDMLGTMIAVAKDAKIQVFFNPARVAAWRLMGYANRRLAARDFNDDRKDAGDVGSGHQVTALYEIVPVGVAAPAGAVDANPFVAPLAGQDGEAAAPAAPDAPDAPDDPAAATKDTDTATASDALLRWRLRAKAPDADTSRLQEGDLVDTGRPFEEAETSLQWAAGVAAFGEWLRGGAALRGLGVDGVLEMLTPAVGEDRERTAFVDLVRRAGALRSR